MQQHTLSCKQLEQPDNSFIRSISLFFRFIDDFIDTYSEKIWMNRLIHLMKSEKNFLYRWQLKKTIEMRHSNRQLITFHIEHDAHMALDKEN